LPSDGAEQLTLNELHCYWLLFNGLLNQLSELSRLINIKTIKTDNAYVIMFSGVNLAKRW